MCNNNRRCYSFVDDLGRELITVLKRQCADLQLSSHYQASRPRYQQHVHFVGTLARVFSLGCKLVGILVPFPGCTLVGILVATFSWLYTLLVPWFPGCTLCWYLGTFSLYTLCWYLGTFSMVSWYLFLVVHTFLVFWYLFLVVHTFLVSWYLFLDVNLAVNLSNVFLSQHQSVET